jgi:3-demethylubiquinone-9 3-methyltransferase
MPVVHKITPCLWFDNQAEEAVAFYTAIFKNSKIVTVSRYGEAGKEIHGKPAGSVMTVAFELEGQTFTALNGGPIFKFNEAISFRWIARRRPRWTTSGRSCPRAGIRTPSSAAGSRTGTASRGRSFPVRWSRCSWTPTRESPRGS